MKNEKILIQVPQHFSYSEALQTIQRSDKDSMNIIRNGRLSRILLINEIPTLLEIEKDGHFIKAAVLNRNFTQEERHIVFSLISELFGLDDPLLTAHFRETHLNYYIGVHGYFSLFEAVVQTIIGQLISTKVADTIRERFIQNFGESIIYNNNTYFLFPQPSVVSKINLKEMQKIGLSKIKSQLIVGLAEEFSLNKLEKILRSLSNSQDIQKFLTKYRGIGRWTSDWISLRALRKFDVIPSGDLLVRKAFTWYLNSPSIVSCDKIDAFCKKWENYSGSFAYRVMFSYMKALNKK